MTDTPETIQAAIDDLKRHVSEVEARLSAFEQAQKRAKEEAPPMLTDGDNLCMERFQHSVVVACYARLRWLEREYARLWEGLKPQPGDLDDRFIAEMADPPSDSTSVARMGREIQRHRRLVKP